MKKLAFITILVIILFSFNSVQAVTFLETQITTNSATQESAKTNDTHVVWLDWRHDSDHGWVSGGGIDQKNKRDIYLYNISDQTETRITSSFNFPTHVDITSQYVFWLDASSANPGIYKYDLSKGQISLAVSLAQYPYWSDYGGSHLSSWNSRVVYSTAGQGGVYLYNAVDGTNTKVVDSYINGLAYENNTLVYTATNASDGKVYKKDLASNTITEISSDSTKAAPFSNNIALMGDNVVWMTGSSTAVELVLFNLSSSESSVITTAPGNFISPAVGKDFAVWSEWEPQVGKYVLAVYKLADGLKNLHSQVQALKPEINDDQVVFHSLRGIKANVYRVDPNTIIPDPVSAGNNCDEAPSDVMVGDLIKGSTKAVYYLGGDCSRYVFPNAKTYFTWYSDFENIKTISDEALAELEIGGNVTYRPGVKMIKVQSGTKVYVVDKSGTRRWVETADAARGLYGEDWSSYVDDIPDAFWTNYSTGNIVKSSQDFDREQVTLENVTINIDKDLE
jgi:hypothetical protein